MTGPAGPATETRCLALSGGVPDVPVYKCIRSVCHKILWGNFGIFFSVHTPIEQRFYRELRSLLCVFSCCSACHCGRCCGPVCETICCETVEQRHERWAEELNADMVRRTEAFMQSYTPKKYAFRKSGSGRLVASTHLAAPAPQTIDRGDAAETENVVVSVKT